MKLESTKVKDLNSKRYVKLTELFCLKKNLDQEVNLTAVQKYHRIVETNKKQPQATMLGAGLRRVAHPAGTNKGRSRQPYASFGYKTIKTNVPNAVKGRKALRFLMNQTTLKCNKKQKYAAVRSLIIMTLKNSKLYTFEENFFNTIKTSDRLRLLKSQVDVRLRSYLQDPKLKTKDRDRLGPVVVTDHSSFLSGLFRNFPNVLYLNSISKRYYDLYRGSRLRLALIFQKKVLEELLKRYQLVE